MKRRKETRELPPQALHANKETLCVMKGALLFHLRHTWGTRFSGPGDLTTLTFSAVINGQAVNYFPLLGGLSSHMPALY